VEGREGKGRAGERRGEKRMGGSPAPLIPPGCRGARIVSAQLMSCVAVVL